MSVAIDVSIRAVAPKADPGFVESSMAVDAAAIMVEYGLTGVNEQAQILAHMSVESGGFRLFAENLNYSAERLTQVWPKRYPTVEAAAPYAHNPKALAINCYGSRGGNRAGTEDGWLYRGSGGLQHTFLPEFERVQKRTGLPVVAFPDMLRDKRNAEAIWRGACSFLVDRKALAVARAGDTEATTIKINGGTNGLADRKVSVARALKALDSSPIQIQGTAVRPKAVLPVEPMPTPEVSPAPEPAPTTAKVEHADPAQRTTVEIEEDEKSKRNKSITGTAVGTPASGGGASQTTKQVDWVLVGGVMLAVALVGAIIIRYFWRRHAEALAAVERQQLTAVIQRVET